MINPKTLEALARQIQASLPKGIKNFSDDIENKIRQVLKKQFNRVDLISREEFALQNERLLRICNTINQLELRLQLLENSKNSAHIDSTESSLSVSSSDLEAQETIKKEQ